MCTTNEVIETLFTQGRKIISQNLWLIPEGGDINVGTKLINTEGNPQIWLNIDNTKRHITSTEVMNGFQFD